MTPAETQREGAATLGKRRAAREMALQMLYQQELAGGAADDLIAQFDLRGFAADHAPGTSLDHLKNGFEYAERIVRGVLELQASLDETIGRHTENWRVERMPIVDRNVLRIAVYELEEQKDVPRIVVVDEAIELAKKFGSEKSGRFVNGLLDGLLQREDAPS